MYLPKINAAIMADLEKDPATEWWLYQVRQAVGGRGSDPKIDKAWGRPHRKAVGGFYLVPEKSKTILEMLQDQRLRPYAEGIVERLKLILKSYQEAGLIK
jgi:hypothetical protein